jgi:hypothetical protein
MALVPVGRCLVTNPDEVAATSSNEPLYDVGSPGPGSKARYQGVSRLLQFALAVGAEAGTRVSVPTESYKQTCGCWTATRARRTFFFTKQA